jgi:hypothetical protein
MQTVASSVLWLRELSKVIMSLVPRKWSTHAGTRPGEMWQWAHVGWTPVAVLPCFDS